MILRMTKIMPDFRAYRKQDKMPSYNDLGQEYPVKLPTRIREEPINSRLHSGKGKPSSKRMTVSSRLWM